MQAAAHNKWHSLGCWTLPVQLTLFSQMGVVARPYWQGSTLPIVPLPAWRQATVAALSVNPILLTVPVAAAAAARGALCAALT